MDQWMTPIRSNETFTTEMLGSVADHWARITENYRPDSLYRSANTAARALRARQGLPEQSFGLVAVPDAYPTLSMSLDIKQLLPPEGVKWLFLRARATSIKNGRVDAEVTILNERLELVALSHQVALMLRSSKRAGEAKGKDGKL